MPNPNQRTAATHYAVITDPPTDPLAALHQANAAESWEWLTIHAPAHAYAVELAIQAGATPDDIYRAMIKDTQRQEFAQRCRLAARHLLEAGK